MSNHKKHEIRSLEIHKLVAEELKKSPKRVIDLALENVRRWREKGVDCADFDEWVKLLTEGRATLPKVLVGTDEKSVRLRQSSPFPGIIPEARRLEIFNAFP